MIQWLRLCNSTAGGTGSTPGQGTKIPHASSHSQEIQNKLKRSKRTTYFESKRRKEN